MRRLFHNSVLLPLAFLLASATISFADPVFTIQNKRDACNNLANGTFDILVTSGTGTIEAFVFSSGPPIGPISIVLNVPSNVSGLSGTVAGRDYLIVVTDNNGSSNTSIKIFKIPDITANLVSSTNSSFCVPPNGAIDINVSGGSGTYAYSWTATNGFTSALQDISALAAGDYTVVVSDIGTNCTKTLGPITITQPAPPLVSNPSATLCVGATMTASPGVGGTWVSSAPGIASINNAGLITGVSVGSATFTFTATATGCSATTSSVSVITLPVVSTPSATLCVGATMTASPGVGGTWVSSAPGVATINNAGLITGISVGSATFTFTATATGCSATTATVNVNALPVVSTPSATLCVGATITASPGVGGTWVSSAPGVATINNAGLITGISVGSATFTFTSTATGCSATTATVNVNALPVVSTPSATLCVGATMTASPGVGGTWVSSAPGVATINNAGLITGVSVGSATFTFTATATGCSKTTPTVNVIALPVVSTPSATLCVGATMSASPGVGGTWVSSAPGVATINNAGLITGVSVGSATFTFTATATGCSATTATVNVNALPVVSTPSATLCVGATMSASPGVGGTWVSSAPGVATINNAGLITGISVGSATFTFTSTATGCSATTASVNVNALPVVSTPSATLCVGATMTASPGAGGVWVSSDAAIATISNLGLITGISAGIVTFSFIDTSTGCIATTAAVTVNALPIVSTPSATLCVGATMTASPAAGGTWVSSAPGIATINNAGLIAGISAGTVTFIYTESATGCSNTTLLVTVENIPNLTLALGTTINPVCIGGVSDVTIANSEVGVSYQLRNDANDSNIGGPVAGTGATIQISTGVLNSTTTFNVLVTRGSCSKELNATIAVNVAGSINGSIGVSPQNNAICEGSGTQINVSNSEVGVNYQLRNDADDSTIGGVVAGNGGTISLLTGNLSTSITFNVLAFNGACSVELASKVSVNVDINPDPTLSVAATLNPLCVGGSTNISVSSSEVGVSYQLRRDSDNSAIGSSVLGTGGQIDLPTGVLNATITFNVLATGGVCVPVQLNNKVTVTVSGTINLTLVPTPALSPICEGGNTNIQIANSEVGVNYQLINDSNNSLVPGVVSGTGISIDLPTGNLITTTTFRVLASSATCSAELTSKATVTITPLPSKGLLVSSASLFVCKLSSTSVRVANSEPGVSYQLRNDADNSSISGPVIGNGNTISLPTGLLTTSKIFNVLATRSTCSIQLTIKAIVVVLNTPKETLSVVAQDPTVCNGNSTVINIQNSEPGIKYQLRDDADNSNVSGSALGNGGTISLPTGPITATRTFNVIASNAFCSIQLTAKATVTLKAVNDPSCSNCSSVIVTTINPKKVTCNVALPDGAIEFDIQPPVPTINIIGVKIQITGPTPKVQTNNFIFTDLAAGNYDYTVTYGDENNPDCIKMGSFIIELSRVPDPITFDLSVDEYDCLINKGSITLENISGAINTDFNFTILNNGATVVQGVIPKSSGTFTIENLLLGNYKIELNQNQLAVNGCVGIVKSQLIDFTIAEPSGGCPVIIPNIFTPNGDGSNDFFEIRNLPVNSTLSVANRWGKEVYSSSNYQNDWTAENISDGIYFYRLVADGEAMTGWVEILR